MKFTLALLMVMLTACAQLGLATPKTFDEQYATGVSACTAALATDDTLLKAHKLTAQDAKNIEKQVDNVKEALDIAYAIHGTDATTGAKKLAAALTTLQALQTYLAGR